MKASNTKIIAMYLPQFHVIPENSKFWGEGYTDWQAVKKAEVLFKDHYQPRIPLNNNYYDLSDKETIKWQINLAKKYGIYGFGIYHYWFSDNINLLTKPSEIILENKDLDINFCFAWDNISWKRTWSKIKGSDWGYSVDNKMRGKKENSGLLVEYVLGEEKEWKKHYKYVLKFFKDSRYIKINNKPIFIIYHYNKQIEKMAMYWNKLAIKDGLEGIYFIFRNDPIHPVNKKYPQFKYEPASSWLNTLTERMLNKFFNKFNINRSPRYSYDKIWQRIINKATKNKNPLLYYGAIVNFDDTPRRGKRARILMKSSPEKFEKYLKMLFTLSCMQKKEYIFLTAWNEWGEGAYLEPDTKNGYSYLKALKRVICNEK